MLPLTFRTSLEHINSISNPPHLFQGRNRRGLRPPACLWLKLPAHLRHVTDVSQFFSWFSSKTNSYCPFQLLHPPAFFALYVNNIRNVGESWSKGAIPDAWGSIRSRTRQQSCCLGPVLNNTRPQTSTFTSLPVTSANFQTRPNSGSRLRICD